MLTPGALTLRRTFLTWGYESNDYSQIEKVWSNSAGFLLMFSDKTMRLISGGGYYDTKVYTNVKNVYTTGSAFAMLYGASSH